MKTSFGLRSERMDYGAFFFSGLTGLATVLILAILAVILGNALYFGAGNLSWHFVSSAPAGGLFDAETTGVLPMILGTTVKVFLMTLFVMPVGVVTAIYMTEYSRVNSLHARLIRGAVNNLAGVPSIVFGLFGLGFFVYFLGGQLDAFLYPDNPKPMWGKPALIWAALTLAVMTLPVVIVTTEEALRAIPIGLREGSLALGATKLQTVMRVVLPQAVPGILTGAILAVSRAAGEVAPILMTGAAYSGGFPKALNAQFMDLGYHVLVLATQSPHVDQARPILYATVVVLLALTFSLNFVGVLLRASVRKKMRMLQA